MYETDEQLRDEFESWYAAKMSADIGKDVSSSEIRDLRKPNGFYGDRGYLNGCWIGFCAGVYRATLEEIDNG